MTAPNYIKTISNLHYNEEFYQIGRGQSEE